MLAHFCVADEGSFAQYLKIPYNCAWKPPKTISDREAATYGVSPLTAMLALYHNLSVPWPDSQQTQPSRTILVYAGSTCAGLSALEMASHAGLKVVTTCSPHSFDLVKKYGAHAAFDYNSPTLVQDIVNEYPDIDSAMDCFSEGGSAIKCAKIIAANGGKGKVITLLPQIGWSWRFPKGVTNQSILAYTLNGREFQMLAPFGPKFKAVPEHRKALERFYGMLHELTDWLRPPPIELVEGGFDSILAGEQKLKEGKVRGKKLVVDLV